jgi:hypothetical protein
MATHQQDYRSTLWRVLIGIVIGCLFTLLFMVSSLYYVPDLLKQVDTYCKDSNNVCNSLRVAAEIGRLDLLTTILGLVGVFTVGFFFFSLSELKTDSMRAAEEVAKQHSEEVAKNYAFQAIKLIRSEFVGHDIDNPKERVKVGIIGERVIEILQSDAFRQHVFNVIMGEISKYQQAKSSDSSGDADNQKREQKLSDSDIE